MTSGGAFGIEYFQIKGLIEKNVNDDSFIEIILDAKKNN